MKTYGYRLPVGRQNSLFHLSRPLGGLTKRFFFRGFGNGFTLTELLVVIAIVGILAAVLFAVLGSARRSARQSVCAQNLRQIGVALTTYAIDHKNITISAGLAVPYVSNGVPAEYFYTWGEAIAIWDGTSGKFASRLKGGGYFGIWRCPDNDAQLVAPVGAGGGEVQGSYMINGVALTGGSHGTVNTENRYTNQYMSVFAQPSKLLMVTEGVYYSMDNKEQGLSVVPTDLPSDQFSGKGFNSVRYPHNQKVNAVFADGHVETLAGPLTKGQSLGGDGRHASSYTLGNRWFAN